MSFTVILADYYSGTISVAEALRRSGFSRIDELVHAAQATGSARSSRFSTPVPVRQPRRLAELA